MGFVSHSDPPRVRATPSFLSLVCLQVPISSPLFQNNSQHSRALVCARHWAKLFRGTISFGCLTRFYEGVTVACSTEEQKLNNVLMFTQTLGFKSRLDPRGQLSLIIKGGSEWLTGLWPSRGKLASCNGFRSQTRQAQIQLSSPMVWLWEKFPNYPELSFPFCKMVLTVMVATA